MQSLKIFSVGFSPKYNLFVKDHSYLKVFLTIEHHESKHISVFEVLVVNLWNAIFLAVRTAVS